MMRDAPQRSTGPSTLSNTTGSHSMPEGLVLEVDRKRWADARIRPLPVPERLEPGQVLFRVDRFALTANNITYCVAGDLLNYWGFFPGSEEGQGRIPVMGFGEVLESASADAEPGERFFGFFPMATHLLIQAEANHDGLVDVSPHRAQHAPVYRQYTRASTDPFYTLEGEDRMLLLRGLFLTSFLVDDYVADHDGFGAKRLIISSASSKTSIALAFQASQRDGLEVVGLTSPSNAAFVRGLGDYDRVVEYDALETLEAGVPSVFVDMAGDAEVGRRLHVHLGDALRFHSSVGATHWESGGAQGEVPGVAPEFFFAPAQIVKRTQDWGPGKLQEKMAGDWARFREGSKSWLEVVRRSGPEPVAEIYTRTLENRTPPREGQILSLWTDR